MKRILTAAALLLLATTTFAGPQFRLAGNALTPLTDLPETPQEWDAAIGSTGNTLSGWHWEVLLDHFGFGMHYGVRFYETEVVETPYFIDWKGDFFLSYHFMGGGSPLDPFVEVGWGNAGSAAVDSRHDAEYPDWEDRVDDGSATALALYSYAAAGVALDLNGLLLGVRLAYMPSHMANPVPDPDLGFYQLPEFELGFFGGVALGSHDRWRREHSWSDRHRW